MRSQADADTKSQSLSELRKTLISMLAEARGIEAIDLMIEMLSALQSENHTLSVRLGKELKARFGQTSEKISGSQLSLFLSLLGVDEKNSDEKTEDLDAKNTGDQELDEHFRDKDKKKKQKKPTGRKALPDDLPREKILIPVPESLRVCSVCGTNKQCMGHDTSEVLEWEPGRFKVLVFAREKLACKPCQGDVVIAPVADKVIDGGLPGPALLTELVLKKFKYAQPLWRQAHYFQTLGVEIAESTLCGWIKYASLLLEPVWREIIRLALLSHLIQTDDTHIRVLDRSHAKGIKRGSMWVYIGDKKYAFFDYSPDRSSASPRKFLLGFGGKVQADAYSAYDFLFQGEDASAIEVGCFMHARRYFVEALDAGCMEAAIFVRHFRILFKIEEYAKDLGMTDVERLKIRQEKSKPVMDKLGQRIANHHMAAEKDSPMGKATGYAMRQWDALCRFLEDGALEIDNGLSERVIRTVAIGRKNYMFAGSDAGAERAAILYSLIASCDLAGVDTAAYLKDVMMKIATGWPQARISQLVPSNWTAPEAETKKSQPLHLDVAA